MLPLSLSVAECVIRLGRFRRYVTQGSQPGSFFQ